MNGPSSQSWDLSVLACNTIIVPRLHIGQMFDRRHSAGWRSRRGLQQCLREAGTVWETWWPYVTTRCRVSCADCMAWNHPCSRKLCLAVTDAPAGPRNAKRGDSVQDLYRWTGAVPAVQFQDTVGICCAILYLNSTSATWKYVPSKDRRSDHRIKCPNSARTSPTHPCAYRPAGTRPSRRATACPARRAAGPRRHERPRCGRRWGLAHRTVLAWEVCRSLCEGQPVHWGTAVAAGGRRAAADAPTWRAGGRRSKQNAPSGAAT